MVNVLDTSHTIKECINILKTQNENLYISGVNDESKSGIASSIIKLYDNKFPSLIICSNDEIANKFYADLSIYINNVFLYPTRDLLFAYANVDSQEVSNSRLEIIDKLKNNESITVVANIDSLAEKIISKSDFENSKIKIRSGEKYSLDSFIKNLSDINYTRSFEVNNYGEYACRGGIVDVFSHGHDSPIRIEFAYDQIDSIREFNIDTRRTTKHLEEIIIFPASEDFSKNENKQSLIEYFPYDSIVVVDDYRKLNERYDAIFEMLPDNLINLASEKNIDSIIEDDEYISKSDEIRPVEIYSKEEFLDFIYRRNNMVFFNTFDSNLDFNSQVRFKDINMNMRSVSLIKNNMEVFYEELSKLSNENYKGIITVNSITRGYRLYEEFNAHNFKSKIIENKTDEDDFNNLLKSSGINIFIAIGNLEEGFIYDDEKLYLICENDIYGTNINSNVRKDTRKRKKANDAILNLSDLRLGDYVVHENYGIGVYKGSTYIKIDDVTKEYIEIEYADDGKIFLPISSMDLIQKYRSDDDDIAPRLDRIGSARWDETKKRVRRELELIANDLVELYAIRNNSKGYAFSDDNDWQREFEETFEYEETEDQLIAIENTKHDMEQDKPMDRLICGDVGFGKTEVAIRAAFKAVLDQKQVAYLVPTTVLCKQHYNTFIERMMSFPVRVDYLSGYKSPAENKKTLDKLASGEIDIIIGTHRLLSNDVRFKDLGLLIIDEEQRFGVTHKEKIKQLKAGIDVLTLSATPIPRTLHMSLIGIKDMSILKDPPVNRKPISTFVMEYNDEIVKSAIDRELARSGQVFYVHNRVKGILEIGKRIKLLCPKANVGIAHGQMNKNELDKIMFEFIDKKIDVLVVTTIIETGIDIQNANTLIVDDANKYGLAQLYQLRGRVGRSSTKANAFFMYRKGTMLNEQSEFKLKSIKNYNSLGSGLNIARKDLELRGAGTILGKIQHGHFNYIGYEMYYKMLTKAIENIKTNSTEEEFNTSIDIDINAFIPNEYIENENVKIDFYKKIASCITKEDVDDIEKEMIDRFGPIPLEIKNLLRVEKLKIFAHNLYIAEVKISKERIVLKFIKNAKVDLDKLKSLVENNIGHIRVVSSTEPEISYINYGEVLIEESFDKCISLLKQLS